MKNLINKKKRKKIVSLSIAFKIQLEGTLGGF